MGVMEMFFPEMMEAEHLREISSTLKTSNFRARRNNVATADKIASLAMDMESLSLILCALVSKLVEDGVVTREELIEKIDTLDVLDGRRNGRLNAKIARGAMGVKAPVPKKSPLTALKKRKHVSKIPKPKHR